MRTIFLKTALAMAASCLLYQPANAGWTVKVTPQNSPAGAPTIEVYSSGNEWTDIKSDWKKVKLSTEVKVSSGWRVVKVYLGFPSADFCSPESTEGCTNIYSGRTKHVKLDGREYDFSTDHIGGLDAQAIVNACNAGDHDPTKERAPFASEISVGIKARIPRRSETNDAHEPGDYGREEFDYARVPVIVRCLAPVAMLQAAPKPFSVEVFVQQGGQTCPKQTEVKARIKYQVPTTSRFRFKVDGKPSKWFNVKARKEPPNSPPPKPVYLVEHVKTYHLDPGQHHFRVEAEDGKQSAVRTLEITCPPFQATSMWLTLNTEDKDTCPKNVDATVRINGNRPGSVLTKIKNQAGVVMAIESIKVEREGNQYVGRLTKKFNMTAIDTMLIAEDANDSAVNSGWQPLKIECEYKPIDTGTSDLAPELPPGDPPVVGPTLTGDFSFVDNGGTRCPRQGKALINFKTSKPDNVHWSLDCTNGHFSGVAQTAPSPKGGYIAPAIASFAVNQTTHAKCALKTVAPGKAKVHTLKGHVFQCVNRTDVGGPEDLTPETPSDPQKPGTAIVDPVKPEQPSTAVVDPVKISCANGKVKGGACECEPYFKPVKAGKHAWRCVRSTADPKPETPIVSEPKVSCARGKVVNDTCKCAKTDKLTKTGKNAWACVKVVVDPPRNKDKTKLEVKTAPKKTAAPKSGNADKGGKGKGKTAKQGNGSSALR